MVAEGEPGGVGLAAVGADGEVEQDVVLEARDGVREGILRVALIAAVEGLREIDLVEQFIVEIEADVVLVPVHAPDVELVGPARILVREMGEEGRPSTSNSSLHTRR